MDDGKRHVRLGLLCKKTNKVWLLIHPRKCVGSVKLVMVACAGQHSWLCVELLKNELKSRCLIGESTEVLMLRTSVFC